MANRAKLTLLPKKEESALPEIEAANPEIDLVENAPKSKQEQAAHAPSKSGTLVKGLIFAGLTIASVVIFRRKIF
ncbi:hypothetical protein [Desulfovibrio sp. JC010]|uniref:hypothetical protein n=1 Tax=Desulfovibrio sp. JC010 TaxID=2593641 RepID=UPI0013CF7151|nr:hypothetical protein [Desulfovibrio sp. JC010]NDV28573.1 hypothetical protein [Desulfovibrio sp. JC010]